MKRDLALHLLAVTRQLAMNAPILQSRLMADEKFHGAILANLRDFGTQNRICARFSDRAENAKFFLD